MSAHQFLFYTNEALPEFLRNQDKAVFTGEQLAEFDEASRAAIREQAEYCTAHPPVAIYRFAIHR